MTPCSAAPIWRSPDKAALPGAGGPRGDGFRAEIAVSLTGAVAAKAWRALAAGKALQNEAPAALTPLTGDATGPADEPSRRLAAAQANRSVLIAPVAPACALVREAERGSGFGALLDAVRALGWLVGAVHQRRGRRAR